MPVSYVLGVDLEREKRPGLRCDARKKVDPDTASALTKGMGAVDRPRTFLRNCLRLSTPTKLGSGTNAATFP